VSTREYGLDPAEDNGDLFANRRIETDISLYRLNSMSRFLSTFLFSIDEFLFRV